MLSRILHLGPRKVAGLARGLKGVRFFSAQIDYHFPQRTHMCGKVDKGLMGREVVVSGWIRDV